MDERNFDTIGTRNKTEATPQINYGKIVSVRGSVIDIRFDNNLPPVYALVHIAALHNGQCSAMVNSTAKHIKHAAKNFFAYRHRKLLPLSFRDHAARQPLCRV